MATRRRHSTKGTRSKTHKGRRNYTTKKGDKVFHRKGHNVHKKRKPYTKRAKRGGGPAGSATRGCLNPKYNMYNMWNPLSNEPQYIQIPTVLPCPKIY
jgi:hypothetical protein